MMSINLVDSLTCVKYTNDMLSAYVTLYVDDKSPPF